MLILPLSLTWIFLLTAFYVSAADVQLSILTDVRGAICRSVQKRADNDADSFVKLIADESIVGYKIPALIFNYQDIANFSSVPTIETFTDLYRANKTDLYPRMLSEGVFNLDAAEGHSVNKSRFWSGIIDKEITFRVPSVPTIETFTDLYRANKTDLYPRMLSEGVFNLDAAEGHSVNKSRFWSGIIDKEITFRVPVSGIYCVYIAPDPMKVPDFELPIEFRNYYGSLNHIRHLRHTSLKWEVVFSISMFAVILYYSSRFACEEGPQNLNPAQAVTRTIICLSIIPFISISVLELIYWTIRNNSYTTYQSSTLLSNLRLILQFAEYSYSAFTSYVTLLFSMGFGVIYYYHDGLQNYRQLPKDLFQKATALLITQVLITFLHAYSKSTYTSVSITKFLLIVATTILKVVWKALWLVSSARFVFRTKKSIGALLPHPDVQSTYETFSAFKKSVVVIVVLLLFFSGIVAAVDQPTVLTYKQGVFCSAVQRTENIEKAYVELRASQDVVDKKIPGLIFHYPEIVNFSSVPVLEVFTQLYPNNKDHLYKQMLNDEGKFKLDAAEGYSVDDSRFWSGVIDKDVKFDIPTSGIYCVYIAPDDAKEFDFELPVVFKNYYGNLAYPEYLIYSQLKYVIGLAIVLFAALFNYILRFKIGKDFQNMDSISVISKTIIFLILAPFIAIYIFDWFVLLLRNNFEGSHQKSFILSVLRFFAQFGDALYNAFTSFAVLLLSMGFGVIYYYNGNSQHYRLFPQESMKKITAFFFVNIIVLFLYCLSLQRTSETPLVGVTQNSFDGKFSALVGALTSLFGLSWFVLSVIFYFKTKKTIATFPPASDADSTAKIVSAFNKSFFVILVLPFITAILAGIVAGIFMVKPLGNVPDFPKHTDREIVYQSATAIIVLENTFSGILLPIVWSGWLYFFALVISIFFIWIKDNNGLIVDHNANDPIEYADVPNFDISDGEDEEDIRV
ncbi:hypothetical protein CANMA_003911 [Candida margitis]|uniref:uncharacterized protein n=1 Tax=Candida margitis TaxID=1775924 RepID=UPI002225F961|nr:uncharacterized protein CANMA_003911 [Candida margitis]KAI5961137.1 hypothetical protein CANMA_003911 [Candida margitis]